LVRTSTQTTAILFKICLRNYMVTEECCLLGCNDF
jgi:hypothetical protein